MAKKIEHKILMELATLTPKQKQRVLDYARVVAGRTRGTPGHRLLRFAGCISPEDARQMREAIDEAFERVDPAGW